MSCNKLRKADCESRSKCSWVVGKGCKAASTAAASAKPAVAKPAVAKPTVANPSTSKMVIYKDAEIDKVRNDVHPDFTMLKVAKTHLNEIVVNMLASAFRKVNVDEITEIQVTHLNLLGQWSKLEENGRKEAARAMKGELKLVAKEAAFLKRLQFKNKHGKVLTFTKKGALYLQAIIEYLYAEVIELAGFEAMYVNKKRITVDHIDQGIHKDAEIKDAFKPSKDHATYVYNNKEVL